MKFGMKRQILLATLSCIAWGNVMGWNEWATVWPSDQYYHLSTNVLVTNLVAQQYTAEFYRYVVGLPTNETIPLTVWEEGRGNENIQAYTNGNEQWWTNVWYAEIRLYENAATTNGWVTGPTTNTDLQYVGALTTMTECVTSSEVVDFSGMFDAFDLQQLEVYLAIQERNDALGQTFDESIVSLSDYSEMGGFYRDARLNCKLSKAWIEDNYDKFWHPRILTNAGALSKYNYTTNKLDWDYIRDNVTGLPTNNVIFNGGVIWFLTTPRHGLNGSYPHDYGPTMTQTFTVAGGSTPTEVVTNEFRLFNYGLIDEYWPSVFLVTPTTADIVGTNGQVVSVVVTNELIALLGDNYGIQPNTKMSDYTYKHIPDVLDLLTITKEPAQFVRQSICTNSTRLVTNLHTWVQDLDNECADGSWWDPSMVCSDIVVTNFMPYNTSYASYRYYWWQYVDDDPEAGTNQLCTLRLRSTYTPSRIHFDIGTTATVDLVVWIEAEVYDRVFTNNSSQTYEPDLVGEYAFPDGWSRYIVSVTNAQEGLGGEVFCATNAPYPTGALADRPDIAMQHDWDFGQDPDLEFWWALGILDQRSETKTIYAWVNWTNHFVYK